MAQQQQQHFLQQQVAEVAAYTNATNKRMGNGSARPNWAWQDKWVLELLLLWGLDYQGACMAVDWQWVWED
jgi:hypothetical protein